MLLEMVVFLVMIVTGDWGGDIKDLKEVREAQWGKTYRKAPNWYTAQSLEPAWSFQGLPK